MTQKQFICRALAAAGAPMDPLDLEGRIREISRMEVPMSDYDSDILVWSEHQANLLRRLAAGEPAAEDGAGTPVSCPSGS